MKKFKEMVAMVVARVLAMFWPRFKEGQVMATLEDLQAAVKSGWSFKGIVTMEHWRNGEKLY